MILPEGQSLIILSRFSYDAFVLNNFNSIKITRAILYLEAPKTNSAYM